jgi:hypothetical protein
VIRALVSIVAHLAGLLVLSGSVHPVGTLVLLRFPTTRRVAVSQLPIFRDLGDR